MKIWFTAAIMILLHGCAASFRAVSSVDMEDGGEQPAKDSNLQSDESGASIEPASPPKADCQDEVELPDQPAALVEVFNWQATGSTASYNQVMATPVLGLLQKQDKVPTIVAPAFQTCDYKSGGAFLYGISGDNGQQKWVSGVKVLASASAAIGDIDGQGDNEIVAFGLDKYVYAFDHNGKQKWRSDATALLSHTSFGGPVLADLDNDGNVEVVAQTRVLNGKNGKTKFAISSTGYYTNIVADTDGEPGLEIVTYDKIYKANGQILCSLPLPLFHQAAGRLKADDKTATIIGRTNHAGVDYVRGFDGKTCAEVFSAEFPGKGGGPYNIADFDGDGVLDFGAAGSKYFMAFGLGVAIKWARPTKDASSRSTGATTFDFNGDGKSEIVYNDEDYLRIFDGSTGKVLYESQNSSGTLYEYPVVADATGDGRANIVVGANDCFNYTNKSHKGIRVFRSSKNTWVKTRPIWNQHAYDALLVGDKGEVAGVDAEKIYKPWLSSRHLVGFRNNIGKPAKSDPQCVDK